VRLQPIAALLLTGVLIGIPLWLVVVTSGKSQGEALSPNLRLPTEWQLVENYRQAFTQGEVLRGLYGSALVVAPSVLGVLILGSMAAWIFARRATRTNTVLYAVAISGILVPPAVVTIVLLLRHLNLSGSPIGMIGVYMGMYISTVIFFVTGFIGTIPPELEEAARVDGASPRRVFFKVIFPLLRPVIASATILITLYTWNDVFYAFFVLSSGETATLPLNLYRVASAGQYLNNWHLIFAYVVLMSLPLLAVFAFAQRRIISGITSGAVK
jgi:raffinose/stachyose/melibiose transport system permease protein